MLFLISWNENPYLNYECYLQKDVINHDLKNIEVPHTKWFRMIQSSLEGTMGLFVFFHVN